MKRLTKPLAAALGFGGAAVAAPLLAPYLATASLPFFGAVLAGVFKTEDFTEGVGKAIINTASNVFANLGSSALERLPGALGADHNYHLEKMLATAYLESLEAVGKEIDAGGGDELKRHAARVVPALAARLRRGLRETDLSQLFPLDSEYQPAATAFANRFSAEDVSLLIADEKGWREQLGDEVEIALRRWLGEQRAEEERRAGGTVLGLSPDEPLPDPLRERLRAELPHRIAHRISELVKREEFKESWIAFQRAHLQGMLAVLGRIEGSQDEIKESVAALSGRIEGFARQDELVRELGDKLEEFLSKSHLPPEELTRLLERQSGELIAELRGVEQRLGGKIEESAARLSAENKDHVERLSAEGRGHAAALSERLDGIGRKFDKVEEAILQGAARAAQNRLRQLPAPPRDFTGRAADLEELRGLLRQGGVTISGVQGLGGVGKTALALVLAHEFKAEYPDAQIFLDLKGVGPQPLTPADVMWHVVSSFQPDVKRPDDDQLPAWYNSLLNEHRVLLLYDNVKDAAQVAPLLPPGNCLLLLTSRKHFSLRGMSEKNLDEMTPADAEKLLLKIAPRIAGHAEEIAEQCGRLPIALCAAASALKAKRTLTPEDYLRRLRERKERLRLHDEERDLTVEACFGLSYDLLTAEQQTRWRPLAIFPGDFDAPAAAAIWQTDVDTALHALADLEEYSLLDWEQSTRRYSLHDLARDYADTRLSETEREQSGLLHAAHYLQILSTASDLYLKGGKAITEGLSLLDNERTNIEAGQEWAAARSAKDERAAQFCKSYPGVGIGVLRLRQHPRDSIRWLEAALSAARQLKDRAAEGRLLSHLGVIYAEVGEGQRAIEFFEQALDANRNLDDRRGEGGTLGNLGLTYVYLGQTQRAIELFKQSLVIAREIGDRRIEGSALGNLGLAYVNMGAARHAIEFQEQHLAIARELGDRLAEDTALGNLGLAYADLGEARRAVEFYEQQLIITREIGDQLGEGVALGNMSNAYRDLGETEKAAGFMEAALKIFEEIESPHATTARQLLEELRGSDK